jgi:hypothetical protein
MKTVYKGIHPSIHINSPATPASDISTGRGGAAAADAAEESASSDCASEAAGEVGSSTAVSMKADMMHCVWRKSVRRERRESEIQS